MGFGGSFVEPYDCCQDNKEFGISDVSEHVQQPKTETLTCASQVGNFECDGENKTSHDNDINILQQVVSCNSYPKVIIKAVFFFSFQ